MPIRQIVLATRNAGKVREISQVLAVLGVRLASLGQFPDIPQPEEHGDTFADNAREKALYYARATGQWCLADDSGLVVDALGGEPGVRSARYAAEALAAGLRRASFGPEPQGRGQSRRADRRTADQANNAKLLRELEGVDDQQRTARFTCHLALADAHRILLEACDSVEGRIGHQALGDNGFGYDPLFVVTSHGRTMAQLPADEKNRISHRGKALRKLAAMLPELLG
jgi:XTP/dITP diphosphohydrolase